MSRRLFIDLDGVLANFDGGVRMLFGMGADDFIAERGKGAFWSRLSQQPDFYGKLEPLADANQLMRSVAHLEPTILTGLPIGNWAEPQKREWVARHFPGTPVVTCLSRDKHLHGAPGDVLVDDTVRLAAAWEAMGGHFVAHKNAERSIAALRTWFQI